MSPAQIEFTHMHTVDASLRHLFDGDAAGLAEAETFRRQMTYEPFISRMVMEPFLLDLLDRLRWGCRTAVATNRTDTVDRVLRHWGLKNAFDLVVSASDVQRPKPHPDMILRIVSHFGVEPGEVVYIGDSKLDEKAARSAGVRFFAFRNDSLDADVHLTSLGEVVHLVGKGR
jgi:HAD superfamily hydrolase (TIGR01509 family)